MSLLRLRRSEESAAIAGRAVAPLGEAHVPAGPLAIGTAQVMLLVIVDLTTCDVLARAQTKASAERTGGPAATAPHGARNSHEINVAPRARAARAAELGTPLAPNGGPAGPDQLWSERRRAPGRIGRTKPSKGASARKAAGETAGAGRSLRSGSDASAWDAVAEAVRESTVTAPTPNSTPRRVPTAIWALRDMSGALGF